MAYYLFRKRGQHLATHLAVGRGKYLVTSCGTTYTFRSSDYRQGTKTRIERRHLTGGAGTNRPVTIVPPLPILGVTCAHCLRLPPPPAWEPIPPSHSSTKPGQRRITPRDTKPRDT